MLFITLFEQNFYIFIETKSFSKGKAKSPNFKTAQFLTAYSQFWTIFEIFCKQRSPQNTALERLTISTFSKKKSVKLVSKTDFFLEKLSLKFFSILVANQCTKFKLFTKIKFESVQRQNFVTSSVHFLSNFS